MKPYILLHIWHPLAIALVAGLALAVGVALYAWLLLSQKREKGRQVAVCVENQ
jgi:hypothetical protein